jgi:quercetin dioxygenase-like cupin family protein
MDVAIMSLLYTSAGSYSSKGQASQAWKAIFAFACCTALLLVAAPGLQMVQASDADPLQDFCVADLSNSAPHVNGFACKPRATVTSKDFVFTGFRKAGNYSVTGTNAIATLGDVKQYPALNTQGISHGRLDFGVGGVFPPHIHPLATETLFVVQGSIYTGFISYDNVLYAEVLQQGDVFIFPRASLHFQINVGKGPAVTFNSLNSQDPGFLITANQLLATNISSKVLEVSLGINSKELHLLQASVPPFWNQAAP